MLLALRAAAVPSFDSNSLLRIFISAPARRRSRLHPSSPRPAAHHQRLDAQFQAYGPLHSLDGSGWFELDSGSVYGEPVTRIRAQGTIANQIFSSPPSPSATRRQHRRHRQL